jgi:hypothetical protein
MDSASESDAANLTGSDVKPWGNHLVSLVQKAEFRKVGLARCGAMMPVEDFTRGGQDVSAL